MIHARRAMLFAAVVVAIATATTPCPALAQTAGWRYTRWGMSPDQVVQASPGELGQDAQPVDAGPGRQELRTRTAGDDATFDLTFGFAATGLVDVTLSPTDPAACPRLKAQILDARGAPGRSTTGAGQTTSQWYDDLTAAEVSLVELGTDDFGCRVVYRGASPPRRR